MKQIIYGDEARQKLLEGVNKLSRAVVTTLGPRGRNVAIDKKWGPPTVLHDGVSVAKEVELSDPFENMGAQLVKEASSKTNDAAGDGTTTATLLAQQIVNKGMKYVTSGTNPMLLKKGIDNAVVKVIEELDKIKQEVKEDDWIKVATVSAQNEFIGSKIVEAIKLVGKDGVVTVEESKGMEFEIEHKQGMVFDKGYASTYFETSQGEAVIENPYILVTDYKINSVNEVVGLFQEVMKETKNIVIIADTIDGEALATLVVNKMRGLLNVLCVNAPAFGERRKEILQDIAILTNSTFISQDLGTKLEDVKMSDLGRCDKVLSTKEYTQIIGGKGDTSQRVKTIKAQLKKSTSDFDKEKLQERLAKLSSGVAVIKVGASSETEMNELKERVKDAIGATKSAIEDGIVSGGGVALLRASECLKIEGTEEEMAGIKVVKESLCEPLRWIAINSGTDAGYVVNKVKETGLGFNSLTLEFEDLIKSGIIDPVKVTKSALINAASVASMILTTDCLITDIKKEEKIEV